MGNSKSVLIRRIVLSLGVLVMLYAGISSVNYLDKYLHLSDEVSSYNGLMHAVKTGVPLDAPRPESVMYDPDEDYDVYASHKFILYFNVPAYFVVNGLGLRVEKWYGAWPFLLTMVIALAALWIRKKDSGPEELIVLLMPTVLSSWTLSSLHFVRYYGYMYVFGIVCSFAAYKLYTSERPYWLRVLGVLILLLVPGLFHQTLFSLLAFGIIALTVDFFTSGLRKEYPRWLVIGGAIGITALLTIAATVPAVRLNVAIERFFREWDPSTFGQAIGNYMSVNNREGAGWFLFNLILLVGGGYLSFKRNDFFARFFRLSAGYFLFALVLYSMIMGGVFNPPFGFNRYYLIVHVAYLLSIVTFTHMVLAQVFELATRSWTPAVVITIAGAFLYLAAGNIFSPFTMDEQDFSLIPRHDQKALDYVTAQTDQLEKQGSDVVFITGQVGLLQHYFPDIPAYKLGSKTTIDDLHEAAQNHPDAIYFFVMLNKPPRQPVFEFVKAIYPNFTGEMLIKGKQLIRAYDELAPAIKEKYGLMN